MSKMMNVSTGSVQSSEEWADDAMCDGWNYQEAIENGTLVEVVWDVREDWWVEAK